MLISSALTRTGALEKEMKLLFSNNFNWLYLHILKISKAKKEVQHPQALLSRTGRTLTASPAPRTLLRLTKWGMTRPVPISSTKDTFLFLLVPCEAPCVKHFLGLESSS